MLGQGIKTSDDDTSSTQKMFVFVTVFAFYFFVPFIGMQPPKDRTHSQRWDVSVPLYIILLSTTGLAMLMALFFLFFHIKHHNHWYDHYSKHLVLACY